MSTPPAPDPSADERVASPSAKAFVGSRVGHLTLSMLVIELLAGMQVYINQTVLPLVAVDLGARAHYGLVTAAATMPTFLTMPLGGTMLARWRADHLMAVLTAMLVAGAAAGALAPNVVVYVLGEVVRGLAAGALATVTMGAMVAGLPEAWRRAFLAASSAMWVVSSLAGPVYAATISSGWGWRWALVAYVPVLVAARLVMARQIQGLRVSGGDNDDSDNGGNGRNDGNDAPLIAALAMACGVALIGLAPAASPWFWPASGLGLVSAVWACSRVFPAGVLRLAPGRRAALATLTWVCASYFALDFLISPAGHDVLVLGPGAVGWALTAAGVLWSAAAMWCGAHPAWKGHEYLVRTGLGGLLFAVGGGILAAALLGAVPWWGLHLGWGLSGLGMGLTHQDTLIRCVTDPVELGQRNDGISQAQAATAVTVAANIGGATLGTLVTTLVALTSAGVEERLVVPVVVVITIMLSGTPLLARRAA